MQKLTFIVGNKAQQAAVVALATSVGALFVGDFPTTYPYNLALSKTLSSGPVSNVFGHCSVVGEKHGYTVIDLVGVKLVEGLGRYSAVISDVVQVGCQTFTHKQVKELACKIRSIS